MAGLDGGHWGLLPALLGLVWIVHSGQWSGEMLPGCLVVLAGLVACYDLASRRIPNTLTALTAAAGLVQGLVNQGLAGGLEAFLAGLVGFSLMALFFFLGAVGAGDVKALGALSTFLTPLGALQLFVLTTLAGGLLALLSLVAVAIKGPGRLSVLGGSLTNFRLGRTGLTLPYGLAIWGGVMALVALGGVR